MGEALLSRCMISGTSSSSYYFQTEILASNGVCIAPKAKNQSFDVRAMSVHLVGAVDPILIDRD